MKKFYIGLCAFAIALIFTAASVWEGSVAVANAGELPDGAYYVATNSFPRNTVVDLTNLENSRTIRVIVAAGLDSPGLLALLSHNAAIAIGLQTRAIGRIRMSQTSDPVAYSRFIEGHDGIDPVEAISNLPAVIVPNSPGVINGPARPASTEELSDSSPEDNFYRAVVNASEPYIPPPATFPTDLSVRREPQPTWVLNGSEPTPRIIVQDPATGPSSGAVPGASVPPSDPASGSSGSVLAASASRPATPAASTITLVPSGVRPPAGDVTLPAGSEVGPIQRQAPRGTGDDTYLDQRYFIGPILPRPVAPSVTPVPASPPVQPGPLPAAGTVPVQPQPPSGVRFSSSIPMITQLAGDKYYIQIGAFTQPDTLESVAGRLDRIYPMTIQAGREHNSPVYRLLVGPLNIGESGALLERLKRNGYPDAFIRNGSRDRM